MIFQDQLLQTATGKEALRRAVQCLTSHDPEAVWELSDIREMVLLNGNSMPLGKALLLGREGGGVLDISAGSKSRVRLDAYTKNEPVKYAGRVSSPNSGLA